MKLSKLITGNLLLALVASGTLTAAAQTTRFDSKPGTLKVRIEGTSNIHDWQVEGKLIGGYLEVGPGFPVEPGQAATPGKVQAKVEAFIPVRSMASVEKDGKPYSTKMDDIMYEKLKAQEFPRIFYRLTELTLKEPAKSKGPVCFRCQRRAGGGGGDQHHFDAGEHHAAGRGTAARDRFGGREDD
mgnify:CR=1 FL=1